MAGRNARFRKATATRTVEAYPALAQLPTGVRRAHVVDLVRRKQFASVAGLSATFGVSEVTIRNDLDVLAEEGQLRRVRGGAVHAATGARETPFEQALVARAAEKAWIGAAAAGLAESGQTVFLDVGSTAAAVARALVARTELEEVTVFTNGLRIALELEPAIPRFSVILTGGTLWKLQHSLVNPLGTIILEQVHAHLGFLECAGIDAEAGITNINVAEVGGEAPDDARRSPARRRGRRLEDRASQPGPPVRHR